MTHRVGVREGLAMSSASTRDDPSLCVGCGLCCDGTLLSHLALSDESDLGAPLMAMGVEVIVEADPPVFALPCPAVDEGVCSIYRQHRPRACSLFECDLTRAVADGRLSLEDARQVIADTVVLRDEVSAGTAAPEELEQRVARHFRTR